MVEHLECATIRAVCYDHGSELCVEECLVTVWTNLSLRDP